MRRTHLIQTAFSFCPKKMSKDFLLSNLECCKCARMRFHCVNVLIVLRSCASWREHWFWPWKRLGVFHAEQSRAEQTMSEDGTSDVKSGTAIDGANMPEVL